MSAIFDAVGGVLTVPESQLDAVTAVSGSGPAYFFLMVEALVDAGVAAGLTPCRWPPIWSSQTMAGSAAMLLERLDDGAAGRRRGDGHRDGHHRRPAARHGHLAGRHHRRWAAGTRTGRLAGGGRRGRRGRKNAL